jgi:multimeric flavodoxin WrbA
VDVVVVSASPNREGLTAACARAAVRGAKGAGAHAEEIRLNDFEVGSCQACGSGWGTCRTDHRCQVQDDFQALHERVTRADALALVTPVYYGQPSESAKAFTDRFRRCEATRGDESALAGKPLILVAAAGGGGGGTVTCLQALENWAHHVRARVFDLVPVKRWTRAHKLLSIEAAAAAWVGES